jgi:Rps23 Pro-64 3,4-dihydroxylase Tpa1-like proline 4-hydroxylase
VPVAVAPVTPPVVPADDLRATITGWLREKLISPAEAVALLRGST